MDSASISRIEEWDSRPVPGGYAGLNELADSGFTGAAAAGGTRLVMLNGRVVGVFDGDLSAFEDGEATAYEAPDPALPLLIAMWERDGEVRGSYYTDDTPIREVDETLTSGGFSGYLELSENVLSGDYYVVYYGGRSLAVAFVGNNRRVVTGEEAMELAADEVGIYEVRAVDLEVTDVPEPPEDAAAAGAASAGGGDGSAGDEPGEGEPATGDDAADGAEAGADAVEDAEAAAGGAEADDPGPVTGPEGDAAAGEPGPAEATDEPPEVPVAEAEPAATPDESGPEAGEPDAAPDAAQATGPDRGTGDGGEPPEPAPASSEGTARPGEPADRDDPSERFEEEARWREARTVPALDPEESEVPGEPAAAGSGGAPPDADQAPSREAAAPAGEVRALRERVQRLESELQASEERRRRLDERLEEARAERDDVVAERERLEARISELEGRVAETESAASAAPEAGPTGGQLVDPETALDQTDLFVRYGSKGKATLRTAHDGQAGPEDVAENLRIETHSRFDAATATVDGRPFDDFLEGTIQYRFVAWLVEELLYEIQDTGSEAGLRALYDVLPAIDRAEFNGTVTGRDEEGEEHVESFDVVCRDRMGKPLVVANINDSLDPATGDMMVRLVEDGTAAAESHESIGAAFFVTASFFQPDALETVADATRGGGILSRDSRKSFVKLARNGGYHLCLVEARGDDFHVAVPEF